MSDSLPPLRPGDAVEYIDRIHYLHPDADADADGYTVRGVGKVVDVLRGEAGLVEVVISRGDLEGATGFRLDVRVVDSHVQTIRPAA